MTAGIDYEISKERRKGFENFSGSVLGVRGNLRRNENDTVTSFGQYAQAEWQFAPAWSLSAGVRNTEVKFKSEDFFIRSGNPDDSGGITFRNVNPVLGLLYKATPTLNLYASAGRGLRRLLSPNLPIGRTGQQALIFRFGRARAAISRQESSGWLRIIHASIWHFSRRLLPVKFCLPPIRAAEPLFRMRLIRGGEAWSSRPTPASVRICCYMYLIPISMPSSRIPILTVRPRRLPLVTVAAGNFLPGVPRNTAYAELAWRRGLPGFSRQWRQSIVTIFANDTNTEAANQYAMANIRFAYSHRSAAGRFSEFVRVDNITDTQYVGSVIVNESNGRFYEPSPGRN